MGPFSFVCGRGCRCTLVAERTARPRRVKLRLLSALGRRRMQKSRYVRDNSAASGCVAFSGHMGGDVESGNCSTGAFLIGLDGCPVRLQESC